jgi:hypothetical protein
VPERNFGHFFWLPAKVSHVQPTCQPNFHIANIEVIENCKSLNFLIQLFVKRTKCDECKLGWQVSMRLTLFPRGKFKL